MRLEPHTLLLTLVLSLLGASADDPNRETEAQEAAIEDPDAECQAYGLNWIDTSLFPKIWQYAGGIMANDDEGHRRFAAFNTTIPNIAPRGDIAGDNIDQTMTDYEKQYKGKNSDPFCWWTDTECVTPKLSGLQPDIVTVPEPNTLGYAFDDGPFCGHNRFYNYLASQNQKATFFYIGSNVIDWPLEAQRAVVDGHQMCVHTWSHNYLTAMPNEGVFAELWYTMKVIKYITGITPTCWRPPYGDVDDRIRYIAAQMGLGCPVIWTYDSNDWEQGTDGYTAAQVQANYNKVITAAQNGKFNTHGTIMLTHELNNNTEQMAINNHQTLAGLMNLVPIATAFNQTNPCEEAGKCPMPTFQDYVSARPSSNRSAGH